MKSTASTEILRDEAMNLSEPSKEPTQITLYDMGDHHSFIPFPLRPGKSKKVELHSEIVKAGTEMCLVSFRNAVFMGLKPGRIKLEKDTTIYTLSEEEVADVWMTTNPQEIEQHTRQLRNAHGDVLVGGLGLGVAVGILRQNPKVKSITCVEINPDVIRLVATNAQHYPVRGDMEGKKAITLRADLHKHLKTAKENGITYDFAFYDTWCPTGQRILITDTLPLRRLSEGVVPNDQIECWNEDEMIGQVTSGAMFWTNRDKLDFLERSGSPNPFKATRKEFRRWRRFNRETYPFLAWMRKTKPTTNEATGMLSIYLKSLKDPTQFDGFWKQYDNYGR